MDLNLLYDKYLESGWVCTDTRNISEGCIFFALKGENFNGNKFAHQAIQSGAAYAVIDEEEYRVDDRFILVDDVLVALQGLATIHRTKLHIPVIGVTGSNGKTTSKELIREVLSKKFEVAYTKGNLNNHIGVPLTILEINQSHEIALVEMGDNHCGEVAALCEIAQPNFGFVTNVGKDHLEGFGSFEKNITAKKEVFDYLLAHQGKVFVDLNDSLVSGMLDSYSNRITYGTSASDSFVEFVGANPLVVFKDEEGNEVKSNLFGSFNFNNIKLAYAIGKYFDVDIADISTALSEYLPDNNRSQVVKTEKNTLIMDAYNANPSSVEEAVKSFVKMDSLQPKWIILGDMFELGSFSESEHQNMADLVSASGFEQTILIGENYAKVRTGNGIKVFGKKQDAEVYIKKIAPEGAIILLKGSRGMRLESLKPFL